MSLVDDEEIADLNEAYLGRSGPTNVLSFSMREGEGGGVVPDLLGDVVLSVETARREADSAGLKWTEVLDYYLIHGILHLVGYDHESGGDEAARMEAKTEELLRVLGRPAL